MKSRKPCAVPSGKEGAKDLENALHAACDSGNWEGEVQLVLDKITNQYRLELVTTEEGQKKLSVEEVR